MGLDEGAAQRPLKPDWQWCVVPLEAASASKPHDLEEMLEYIGINKERLAQRTYRRKIQEIVSEAEDLRDVFGIDIRKMKNGKWGVFYEQHEDVWFSNPPKPTALKDQAAEQAVLELETDTDTSSD